MTDLGKWQTITLQRAWGWTTAHVVPIDDLRPHDIEFNGLRDQSCWCRPEHDRADDLVVHNALDGRERHENGAALH